MKKTFALIVVCIPTALGTSDLHDRKVAFANVNVVNPKLNYYNLLKKCSRSKSQNIWHWMTQDGAEVEAETDVTGVSSSPIPSEADLEDWERALQTGNWCQLESVKNCRDLASVCGSGIRPGRVIRTGFLSNASVRDMEIFNERLGLKTVLDLRSPRELGDDKGLIDATIFKNFDEVNWNFPECESGECKLYEGHEQRYFVSLMDEKKYKWGAIRKLKKREKAMVLLYLAAGVASKRAFQRARKVVLRRINEGGLSMLNEMLMLYSGEAVCQCLKIIATRQRHPVAVHCTAGKDRTGFISMLVLKILETPDSNIIEDYTLSDSAYRNLNDRKAMVGALKQEEVDPDRFLCAPAYVMEDTINCIIKQYGSIENYLDSIGFDEEWRAKLKESLTEDR
mmetsp:Transcript_1507/g.2061  ORF Transcript_1507/g.2061 Transcript_1507/m.2061 type:complete len:395 (-) Transcript_1507:272-1456(-)